MKTIITRVVAGIASVLAVLAAPAAPASAAPAAPAAASAHTTTPIQHFVFLMQGDRTFDNYFGTYPEADGIPAGTCLPLVLTRPDSGCVKPYSLHGTAPQPLVPGKSIIETQLNGGKLDGFVAAYTAQGRDGTTAMGHYDQRDLAFYWNVAEQYVLFDRFFAAAPYGFRTNRSYWVSAAPPPGGAERVPAGGYGDQQTIFDLLEEHGVSWKFYIQDYQPQETFRNVSATDPADQTVRVPLLNYARFVDDPKLRVHLADLDEYYRDLRAGTLPAVAYVASSGASERSARSIGAGQKLVRNMVNQLMLSRYWDSSALMWSYDGSGGWYDHVAPPPGMGLRVPALLVSPYARHGQVNHTALDYTSALRFIEENWGIPPLTARDASAETLTSAFDFGTKARSPQLIPAGRVGEAAPLVNVAIIYWLYGGAAVLALLLALAAGRPLARRSLARRSGVRRSRAGRSESGEVSL